MVRSTLKCVMWVGRATVFMVGLAVTVGLIFGVLSRATAHTRSAGLFHLNHNNPVTAISTLTGTLSGAVLKLDNNGTGPALSLEAGSGKAPLSVNTAAGKATNLNADKLDGQEASSFANVAHSHAGEEITSGTVAEPRIDASIARDAEVINTVKANDESGSGLDADTLDGKQAADFDISAIQDSSEPAHQCDTPSTWNQCAKVTFTNLDPSQAYIATVWSSFSAKAPLFSSREVSYCAGFTSSTISPECMNGVNNVRVHDYFTAASASAVSFRFGGQSSMTFYTAINPSAEFEVTSSNQVITTAMLRNV